MAPAESTTQGAGRQSPDPETQSKSQAGAPSSGKGVNDGSDNKKSSKSGLEGLKSNPKGPLDDHVREVAKKTVGNDKGDAKV
ncbi:hypothetical protein BJ878DRAFT_310336 [Calycina marina]|uniref:Uncharacterized protein n=1 Tax=Calycina marina TaxID=1763456 RepID=A0A9P7ZB78_9HELO|nr:hypothetical protein BJ878DRAFT_310336 [Calycina marina]